MSYEKIRSINIDEKEGKVFITGACNNVRPLTYSKEEYPSFSRILQEDGQEAVEIALLKTYEEGSFQQGINKYTRAIKVLRYVFRDEYKKFNWRNHNSIYESEEWKKEKELRKSQDFKDLLRKALNYKLSKDKFILSKIYTGNQRVYLRKCISSAYWTWDKENAKKFNFREELEELKSYYHDGDDWKIEEALK